jgi:ABC-type glycerol-3-phosphate transport system substrate-binding protein
LELPDPNGKGVRSELLQKILKDFEAKNSGVTVKTNVIQWTELGPQLLRAARAGNVPDVVMLYSPFMQPQIGAGSLMPLDDLVKNWSEDDRKDTITLPIARDRKGQLFGIPGSSARTALSTAPTSSRRRPRRGRR